MRYRAFAALLASVPLICALAGVLIDERLHLGYSTWLSACRAAGFTVASLVTFTWELLPAAIMGALAGGLVVLLTGVLLRHRCCAAEAVIAAHAGCALAMAAGLFLCTLALPLPVALLAEAVLAAGFAVWLLRASRRVRIRAYSPTTTRVRKSAATFTGLNCA